MARYLKHTSCSNCGSSDGKGLYDDGSAWCFVCHKYTPANISPYVKQEEENKEKIIYPPDITQEYSPQAMEWFNKYDIKLPMLLKNNVYFSPYRNQVIFGFEDENKNLLAYQARNLSPVNKSKRYYTKGDVNEILPIYCRIPVACVYDNNCTNSNQSVCSRELFLVEDCLSAMKVAEALQGSAMPLLGSGISRAKLMRLRPFYDVLKVFLDGNMWPKAISIAETAKNIGFDAVAVYDDKDPKELSYKELLDKLS